MEVAIMNTGKKDAKLQRTETMNGIINQVEVIQRDGWLQVFQIKIDKENKIKWMLRSVKEKGLINQNIIAFRQNLNKAMVYWS